MSKLQPLRSYHMGIAMGYAQAVSDLATCPEQAVTIAASREKMEQVLAENFSSFDVNDKWYSQFGRGYRRAYSNTVNQ
jgi:hypothetical protein